MQAVCYYGKEDVRVETVPDPRILNPRDAIIKITATAICGSDLHIYGGFIPTMEKGDVLGHEFMGEVVEVGRGNERLKAGDRVVVPFTIACGRCYFCKEQMWSLCDNSNPNAWMAEKLYGYSASGLFGYSHMYGGYLRGQALNYEEHSTYGGTNMAENGTLHDAFIEELRDTYDAEKQLVKALPKLAKAATSPELRAAFETHLEETRGHVDRLEQVFGSLEEKARGKHCEGMAGIIDEGKAIMEEDFDDSTMDASLIAAAQRVEHYEMAAYGTLVAWARGMGHGEAESLLQQTLDEEKAADEKLTQLAESGINQEAADAAHPSDEDEGEDEEEEGGAPARGGRGGAAAVAKRPRRR